MASWEPLIINATASHYALYPLCDQNTAWVGDAGRGHAYVGLDGGGVKDLEERQASNPDFTSLTSDPA